MLNLEIYKQLVRCSKAGRLSVIFSDIYMAEIEKKVFELTKSQFYKILFDDIKNKRYKNPPENLL